MRSGECHSSICYAYKLTVLMSTAMSEYAAKNMLEKTSRRSLFKFPSNIPHTSSLLSGRFPNCD